MSRGFSQVTVIQRHWRESQSKYRREAMVDSVEITSETHTEGRASEQSARGTRPPSHRWISVPLSNLYWEDHLGTRIHGS
jgi:hypothetical protein